MLEITWVDSIVYGVLLAYALIQKHGLTKGIQFFIANFLFLGYQLPLRVLSNRFLKPFEWQNLHNQRASNCEFIMATCLRYFLPKFSSDSMENILFSDAVNRLFYYYRVYTQGFANLGDTTFLEVKTKELDGFWVFSESKGRDKSSVDVLFFYIMGDAFKSSSPFAYLEYIQRFLVTLQEQGFANPVIFVPRTRSTNDERFPGPLIKSIKIWSFLAKEYSSSQMVLGGDSNGASMALALQLLISQAVQQPEYLVGVEATSNTMKKADAMLLVSPIVKYNVARDEKQLSANTDYLTPEILKFWGKEYLGEKVINGSSNDNTRMLGSPGLCRDSAIWSTAFPQSGMIISYGSEELLAPEIDQFVGMLKELGGKLKTDKHNSHLHSWSILTYTTERNVDDREESLNLFSSVLSSLLLSETKTYFQPGAKEPTNVITIDDQVV